MESAGVTLVKGDLRGIVRARRLSRATMATSARTCSSRSSTTRWACRSPPVLYPAFGLLLSPMIAAAAMSLSSVSVIGNALRLRARALTAILRSPCCAGVSRSR
jgi:Cu+-exporting ATPase